MVRLKKKLQMYSHTKNVKLTKMLVNNIMITWKQIIALAQVTLAKYSITMIKKEYNNIKLLYKEIILS